MRIGVIELPPHILADQRHTIAPRLVLIIAKRASHEEMHSEHCGQIGRHFLLLHLHTASGPYDAGRVAAAKHPTDLQPCPHGVAQLQHIGIMHGVVRLGTGTLNCNDTIRPRVGQRTQQNSIQNGEDRDVRAQPQSQHGYCGEGEARRLAQLPQCVTHILQYRLHRSCPFYSIKSALRAYSVRRACMGSTAAARRAGKAAARVTMTAVRITAPARVIGSNVVTP